MKGGKLNKDEIERIKYLSQVQGMLPIEVDVASRVFQVSYWDLSKERIINFQLERSKFFEFIDNLTSKSLFGIEACGSCHYLSRTINAKGHECRILPAGKVKAFLNLDKTDKIDLEFFMLTYAYKKFYKVIGYSILAAS